MMDYGYGMGFGIMGIAGLVFWILIIAGLALLIKYLWQSGAGKEQDSALDILKRRYARGEIGREEFEEKRKDL